MPYPPFSISETTTYPATFEEDLAAYKARASTASASGSSSFPRDRTRAAATRYAPQVSRRPSAFSKVAG